MFGGPQRKKAFEERVSLFKISSQAVQKVLKCEPPTISERYWTPSYYCDIKMDPIQQELQNFVKLKMKKKHEPKLHSRFLPQKWPVADPNQLARSLFSNPWPLHLGTLTWLQEAFVPKIHDSAAEENVALRNGITENEIYCSPMCPQHHRKEGMEYRFVSLCNSEPTNTVVLQVISFPALCLSTLVLVFHP